MDLPKSLIDQIAGGRSVLVLGAGSSMEAKDAAGNPGPSSAKLARKISDQFLGGAYENLPLAQVSELAVSETDLFTVQRYVRSLVEPLEPTSPHFALTCVRWSGLATTNFDRVVEKAYEAAGGDRLQNLGPLICNGDRVDEVMHDPMALPFLKLHGCVTRVEDADCPLILSPDQYVQYRRGRDRVFGHFLDWGFERTIVYIGQSLQDTDLRAILLELAEKCASRPRYYTVTPDVDRAMARFWETKRITALKGTFSDFMIEVEGSIPKHRTTVAQFLTLDIPITRHAKRANVEWSATVRRFLASDVEYVQEATIEAPRPPKDFYKGISKGWSPIEQELDIRRKIGDVIVADCILVEESTDQESLQFIVIKGHAGSGKTVTLRRIAWDAAKSYGCICLFLREYGSLDADAIREISTVCQERVFVFIDDVVSRAIEIDAFADRLGGEDIKVTIIGTARINEWNVGSARIADLVTGEYTVPYLSEPEIDILLEKLEKYHALGTLENRTLQERREALRLRFGRQLLVALHEATLGDRFEKIVLDEYNNVVPLSAQQLYLTVCCLNRFDAPVRAGVISRLHGIPFEQFKERFLGPLEQVVIPSYVREDDDYVYRARHPFIAEMVFRQAAPTGKQKYELYVQCLTALNVDYRSDREVFGRLIHARSLIELFSNFEDIAAIYDYAKKVAPDDPFPYHQQAIFEMLRPNASLTRAAECLARANDLDPHNMAILHSMAELHLKRAEAARTLLEKEKHLDEADTIARSLLKQSSRQSYGYHTLCKVALERIRIYSASDQYDDMVIARTVAAVEKLLTESLQKFPDDSYLLDADAELASLLSDSERALFSLKRAFEANPRAVFAAVRIARILLERGKSTEAKGILQKALDANPSDQKLHFLYAKMLLDEDPIDYSEVLHYLQRSFTPGDGNHAARILYGRALFMSGRRKESEQFFRENRGGRFPGDLAFRPRYPIPNQIFTGQVVSMNGSFGFITLLPTNDRIFFGQQSVSEEGWGLLNRGSRVGFKVAFTARGAIAVEVVTS